MEEQDASTLKQITFVRPGVTAHKRARLTRTRTSIPPGHYTDSLLTEYGRAQASTTAECTSMLDVEVPLSCSVEIEMLTFPPTGRLDREQEYQGVCVKALRTIAPSL